MAVLQWIDETRGCCFQDRLTEQIQACFVFQHLLATRLWSPRSTHQRDIKVHTLLALQTMTPVAHPRCTLKDSVSHRFTRKGFFTGWLLSPLKHILNLSDTPSLNTRHLLQPHHTTLTRCFLCAFPSPPPDSLLQRRDLLGKQDANRQGRGDLWQHQQLSEFAGSGWDDVVWC